MPVVMSFCFDHEFETALNICRSFNLKVSTIFFFDFQSIIFLSDLQHLIFRGWAGHKFLIRFEFCY